MAASIRIDQVRPGPVTSSGTANISRKDLWLGSVVNCVSVGAGPYQWTLLDKPAGSTAALTGPTAATCSFTPDVVGTYRIKLVIDGGTSEQIRLAAVLYDAAGGSLLRLWRVPAFGERADEANFASNLRGWAESLESIFGDIRGKLPPTGVSGDLQINNAGVPGALTGTAGQIARRNISNTSWIAETPLELPVGVAAGDLLGYDGANLQRIPKGTSLQVLRMNAAGTAQEYAASSGGGSPGGVLGDLQKNDGAGGFSALTPGTGVAGALALPTTGTTGAGLVLSEFPTFTGGLRLAAAASGAGIEYRIYPNTLSATRQIFLPTLLADDALVFQAHIQAFTNKTIVAASNTITDTAAALGDLLYFNGTRFVRLARGTANQVLTTNAGATDIYWAAATGGGGTPAGVSGDLQTNNAGVFGAITPGTGISTFLATPSGTNLGSALTSPLSATKGGTGADASAFSGLAKWALGTASASTLVNADVSSTAAIDRSKLAFPGRATQAMADANQAPGTAITSLEIIRTTGVNTLARTLTMPLPASEAASYVRLLENDCTTANTIVSVGVGTTVSLPPGARALLSFTPSGVAFSENVFDYLQFSGNSGDARAAAGLVRLTAYTHDIIAARARDGSGDRVALSQWSPSAVLNELCVGGGQVAITPYDRLVLTGAEFVRALVGSFTAWKSTASGTQFGSATMDLGGGGIVLGITNAATVPTTNPTGGIVVYSEAGVLKYRQPAGTIVTLSGGGGSTPTGTGLRKVVAGVENAAASLLLNADVDAAAAIAGSKVAPDFGAQNVVTTGYGSWGGANPAASGAVRLANGTANAIRQRNPGNTADLDIAFVGVSDELNIWGTGAAYGHAYINIGSGAEVRLQTAAVNVLTTNLNGVVFGSTGTTLYGGGAGVLGIANARTVPTTNPTLGIVAYADPTSGRFTVRQADGTVVPLLTAAAILTSPTISGTPIFTGTSAQATGNARAKAYSDIANVQTVDATVTSLFTWTILDEAATMVTAEVGADLSTGAATAAYVRRARIKRDGGTVTAGTPEATYTDEEAAFASCDVTIDNSTSTGRVRVTGIAANTIDWGGVISRLEVSHA